MAEGWGGPRKGSGRKPKAITEVRRLVFTEATNQAEEALGLLYEFMTDPKLSPSLRRDCANDIMDRVFGKPTQRQVLTGAGGSPICIVEEIICAETPDKADGSAGQVSA